MNASSKIATYTPGVSERRGGSTSFLHAGLKSVDSLSSSSQTLSASRAYDAYGNVVSSSGPWSGPFGYGGAFGYREDGGGLMLLGRRVYDPSTGRFLTRDPAEDGRNWYAYCDGDPVNAADPEGTDKKTLDIIRRGIRQGKLPPGTDDRYINDPAFRGRVHERIGNRKIPGERDNPDLSDEDVTDAVGDELDSNPKPRPRPRRVSPPSTSRSDGSLVVTGLVIGGVILLAGAAILLTGGAAAPIAAGAAAGLIGAAVVGGGRPRRGGA